MPDSITLNKENPLLPAEDYEALRRQGFHAIEQLGSDNWTEYNNSDPGITILEAVCYAITDLAYRTGFEVKDLLTPENLTDDTWKNIFYTARGILHNNPLTLNDYRKLIIDVKGVRNAWLELSKDYEVPVWIDYNYYTQDLDNDCHCEDKEIKGCYGQLGLQPVDIASVNERKRLRLLKIGTDKADNLGKINQFTTEVTVIQEQLDKEPDPQAKATLQQKIDILNKKIDKLTKTNLALTNEENILSSQSFTQPKILELEGLYNVMIEYEENVVKQDHTREEVRQKVIERLSRHRNLCEDFLSVNAVEYSDFGINSHIVLEEYADADTVLAEIFFRIYKYFTPSVPFLTILQMLDKGYQVDEIFEGPALKHGFIETSQLEKTELFRDIRISDIINEIADIRGVKAITHFFIPFMGAGSDLPGDQHSYFAEWVELLKEERKIARLNPSMSFVMFCKERDFITYYTGRPDKDRDPARMLKMFEAFKRQERNYKLSGQDKDFPVPTGEYMELEDYYPITYSLPMCYGVSERAGLPLDASDSRKIQALQLRGYLLFFEQLLSDYLVQLNNLRDLFSFDSKKNRTYYTKALDKVLDLKPLLIDHANHGEEHFDEILADFTKILNDIVEPREVFNKRRNIFLNHLLARFSENLEEYELISRWLTPSRIDERMIADKERILKDGGYSKIGRDRSKAYNYSIPEIWDTDNVSGAETRISRLLGFANADRRSLAPEFIITEAVMITDEKTRTPVQKKNRKEKPLNVIKLMDPGNREKIILTSVEVVEGCCTELLMNEILKYADDRRFFQFPKELKQRSRKTAGVIGAFWFELWDGTDMETATLLAISEKFESKECRDDAYDTLQKIMRQINCNEGLHLVEHLLLRPKFDAVFDEAGKPIPVSFPSICLDLCDIGRGIDDRIKPPQYKKKITRIPADKCYDKMPWVLEYLGLNKVSKAYDRSILFKETFGNGDEPVLLYVRLPLQRPGYGLLGIRGGGQHPRRKPHHGHLDPPFRRLATNNNSGVRQRWPDHLLRLRGRVSEG